MTFFAVRAATSENAKMNLTVFGARGRLICPHFFSIILSLSLDDIMVCLNEKFCATGRMFRHYTVLLFYLHILHPGMMFNVCRASVSGGRCN